MVAYTKVMVFVCFKNEDDAAIFLTVWIGLVLSACMKGI